MKRLLRWSILLAAVFIASASAGLWVLQDRLEGTLYIQPGQGVGDASGLALRVERGVVYARQTLPPPPTPPPPPAAADGGWNVRWEESPPWMEAVTRLDPVFDYRFAGFGYGSEAQYRIEVPMDALLSALMAGRQTTPKAAASFPSLNLSLKGVAIGSMSPGGDGAAVRGQLTGTVVMPGPHAMIPLYAPLLLALLTISGVLLWPTARGAWRRRRGRCGGCGYTRRGLDAGTACPECGAG